MATAVAGAYFPMRARMVGFESVERIVVSNITFNLIAVFFLWGYCCPIITKRVWPSAPPWVSYVLLSVVLLGLIYWMTLWGYEPRVQV